MWPFRRPPDLLEQQRRELDRARRRAERSAGSAEGGPPRWTPPIDPIGGPKPANWHGTGVRIAVHHGDADRPPFEIPTDDLGPPGMTMHEFSGTPGQLAGQLGKALLRALLGRPRRS